MPKNQESLNTDLARQLKRYRPTLRDTSGKVVPVPEEAEVFQFHFTVDGEDYGTVTVSVDGLHKLVIYYSDTVTKSPKVSEHGDLTWTQFLQLMKKFSFQHQLSFELSDQDDLEGDMAKREYTKKLDESYHPMGRKQSYNDAIPECKIIIKHSKVMEEGEQRFRNVERIFIENAQGERFLAPTTRPGIARVYARHIAEGGLPHDDRWNHIGSIVEDYTKMAGFVRATKGKQFNESTTKLVNEGQSHYLSLRESLHKLASHKGYNTYFESWTPPLMEDEMTEDMSNMFMSSSLDPRIESAMPILNKLSKNITEATLDEADVFEAWADDVVESSLTPKTPAQVDDLVELLSKEKIPFGPDAANIKFQLDSIIQDDDLYNTLEQASKKDANADARMAVADWLSTKPEFKLVASKVLAAVEQPVAEEEEANYDDKYQSMVQRVGQKAKAQEKKKPVDIKDLARRLNAIGTKHKEKTDEGDIGAAIGGALGGVAGAELGPVGSMVGSQVGSAIGDKMGDAITDKVAEAGPAGKPGDHLGATDKVSTGKVLGNKPQSQKGLRGKLVGESEALDRIKKLSGL